MSGRGRRRTLLHWLAATFAGVVLSACIIVNPPPAPTPTPIPTPTPTRQTAIDVVRIVEGGDPAIVGQTVRAVLNLDEESYSDRGRWQWERSNDGLTGWINVPGARLTDSSLFTPGSNDEEKYLRASVPFLDSDDVASIGVSPIIGPVETAAIDTSTVDFRFGNDPVVVTRAVRAFITLSSSQYSDAGRWRWDRSDNGLRGWVDVTDYDADDPSIYTAGSADKGKYLRASIVYLDSDDNHRRGLSQTIGPVIAVDTVTGVAEFHQGSNPPRVGTEIRVRISLPGDQFSNVSIWKWERSEDGLRNWEDITNYDSGNSSRHTPSGDDDGHYLRASALYDDSDDERKRALTPTIGPIVR